MSLECAKFVVVGKFPTGRKKMFALQIMAEGKLLPVEKLDYPTLSKAVGGYIERVSLAGKFEGYALYVNEEGKLNGLPRNILATAIWEMVYGMTDTIVGNAVLVSAEIDDEGNEVALTSEQLNNALDLIEKAYSRYAHPSTQNLRK
jgi:hypothetical protein